MSNATQPSRQSGDNRRRRSRGGKNRNRQNDNRQDGDQRENREDRRPNRSEEFRPQAPRPPRARQPVPLSWWQKLLKAVGLYKEPVRPERPERPERQERRPENTQSEQRPAKSNVRNARTQDGVENTSERPPKRDREARNDREARGDREPRAERGERPDRGARSNNRSRGGDSSTVESTRVYVGNLSYDVSEQDLQELFKGIGGVRNVEIVYNRSTHRSKGYGFVEMLHKDDAMRAVEVLHDQHFMGRKMTVSGAKSKGQDERDDQEERPEGESRIVSLAPLPVALTAITPVINDVIEPVTDTVTHFDEPTEPMIQTIVETLSENSHTTSAETEQRSEVH